MICIPCEAEKKRLQLEAYEKLKKRAIEYGKNHNLEKVVIVKTKNHPNFKRVDDPELDRFVIIEYLFV